MLASVFFNELMKVPSSIFILLLQLLLLQRVQNVIFILHSIRQAYANEQLMMRLLEEKI